jgi:hypothetical protein
MIINITLLVLFFILKAIADKISFHFSTSIFSKLPKKYHDFINPSESWDNKWKNNDKSQGERFWGSSKWFVIFTDLWHLIKFLQYIIISLLITLNSELTQYKIIDFSLYLWGGLSVFEFFFSWVFQKKQAFKVKSSGNPR